MHAASHAAHSSSTDELLPPCTLNGAPSARLAGRAALDQTLASAQLHRVVLIHVRRFSGGVDARRGRHYLHPLPGGAPGECVNGLSSIERVLVVEDEADNRDVILELLDLVGYDARGAGEGFEALQILRDGWTPDVIVLDLTMPGMNGWTLVQELCKHPTWDKIPRLVVSAVPPRMLPKEVSATLSKPVFGDQLLEAVERLIRTPLLPAA
jgi:CheY-like chemotaxis protein